MQNRDDVTEAAPRATGSMSARVIAAALSGFVVGAFVALAASGVLSHSAPAAVRAVSTLPPVTPTASSRMYVEVQRIVSRELGLSYPDPKQPRLLALTLMPVAPPLLRGPDTTIIDRYRTVVITFRLNDHPLGPGWRLRAAKSDVFQVVKALYTSQLPIYNVEMVGKFPIRHKHSVKLLRVLTAFLNHTTASQIPWKRWKRTDEQKLWPLLTYSYVRPAFA